MRDSLSGYGKYDQNDLSATRLPTNADVSRLLSKNTSTRGRNVISQLYNESLNKSTLISTSMNVLGTSRFNINDTSKMEPSFAFFTPDREPDTNTDNALEDSMMSKRFF